MPKHTPKGDKEVGVMIRDNIHRQLEMHPHISDK